MIYVRYLSNIGFIQFKLKQETYLNWIIDVNVHVYSLLLLILNIE